MTWYLNINWWFFQSNNEWMNELPTFCRMSKKIKLLFITYIVQTTKCISLSLLEYLFWYVGGLKYVTEKTWHSHETHINQTLYSYCCLGVFMYFDWCFKVWQKKVLAKLLTCDWRWLLPFFLSLLHDLLLFYTLHGVNLLML